MRGTRWLLLVTKSLIPPSELSIVLDVLSQPPFEPLESTDLQRLSLKTALLLALTTAKRVSELHALSVHSSCMQFAVGESKVTLRTNPAFVPKVRETLGQNRSVELLAFFPPPFSSSLSLPSARSIHLRAEN